MLDGQCAIPAPAAASRATSASSKCTPWANQTSPATQPRSSMSCSGTPAEAGEAVGLLLAGLGEVGVQTQAVAARLGGGLAHELGA